MVFSRTAVIDKLNKMKELLIIVFTLLFTSCIVQREELQLLENFEIGCYWTEEFFESKHIEYNEDDYIDFRRSFILEIVEPEYQVEVINFDDPKLEKKRIDDTRHTVVTYRYKTYSFDHETVECYYKLYKRQGYRICYGMSQDIEVISEIELSDMGSNIKVKKSITKPKLIKKYVRRKPDSLKQNQIFIEKGRYHSFSSISHICGETPKKTKSPIRQITEFLIKQGYKISDPDKWNEDVSAALSDFQIKNNLLSEVGKINAETAELIELIELIPRLIKIGYKIDEMNSWSEQANNALIEFQRNNKLIDNIGEFDLKTKRQIEKVEYIPILIEMGYNINEEKFWNPQADKALIEYQIKYNLLINVGELDAYTKNHIKQNKSLVTPVDNK